MRVKTGYLRAKWLENCCRNHQGSGKETSENSKHVEANGGRQSSIHSKHFLYKCLHQILHQQ